MTEQFGRYLLWTFIVPILLVAAAATMAKIFLADPRGVTGTVVLIAALFSALAMAFYSHRKFLNH